MANKRISTLDPLTTPADGDILPITDVDDLTGSAQGTTKGVTVNNLMGQAPVQSVNTATGAVVLDADDIDDTSTSHKFVTASDITNLSNLSGTNSGDQDLSALATQVSLGNHEALTSAVHGISAFGATLVDDADAATARTTLGLGTAATTASTDYATSAQGALADSAQQPPTEGAFVDGDKTKLDGIEASADVTDATNVEAAGALMDSEVTNLAQVKAFDSADYATAAQGTLADSATQPADNVSTLTNDSGYITGVTAGELGDFDFDDNPIFGFAAKVETPTITANAYTLVAADNGKVLALDNGATAMTLNVDTGLPASFNCSFVQKGAGQVSFAGTATVNNRQSHTKINGQYGVASIVAYDTDTYILAGDTAS